MVTCWNDKTDLLYEDLLMPENSNAKIIVVTSTLVTQYIGNYQLGSTSGTKIYINLNIPEVEAFKKLLGDNVPEVERIEVPQPKSTLESMIKNRKSIQELQQIYLQQENDQDMQMTYTCHAEIDMVHVRDFGWKYQSCKVCKSKLHDDRVCKKCNAIEEFPIQRYRIVITAKKEDAYVTIGLFDKSVQKIVGLPISAMLQINTHEHGAEKVCERFENCIGKAYIFRVQVNKRGYTQELTVVKVFNEDEGKEHQAQTEPTTIMPFETVQNSSKNKRPGIEIREPSTPNNDKQMNKKGRKMKDKGISLD